MPALRFRLLFLYGWHIALEAPKYHSMRSTNRTVLLARAFVNSENENSAVAALCHLFQYAKEMDCVDLAGRVAAYASGNCNYEPRQTKLIYIFTPLNKEDSDPDNFR